MEATSPAGRTRTLPADTTTRLRIAIVSCSNYDNGFFTAYENITLRNDVDLVLHLGDYIYENPPSQNSVRPSEPPREVLTLEDYRIRYSHYRLETSLQWLHQNYPMIAVWDDHELANEAWTGGAQKILASTIPTVACSVLRSGSGSMSASKPPQRHGSLCRSQSAWVCAFGCNAAACAGGLVLC